MNYKQRAAAETQTRERAEPEELRNPIPLPLVILSVALMSWAVWYYFANAGVPVTAGDRRTPQVTPTLADVDGSQVFSANCSACHQANGAGLIGVFPPLVNSRWVLSAKDRLVQIMLHGIQGEIEVQGVTYNGAMPAFARLSDAELAAVTSHIRATWGNAAEAITPADIAKGRERFSDRTSPWAGGEELDATFSSADSP